MSGEYYIEINSPAGVPQGEIGDFYSIDIIKRVNEPGSVRFSCHGQHPKLALLADKSQIVVMRRDLAVGLGWYEFFRGIFRAKKYTKPETTEIFETTISGKLSILNWRVNAYKAGVSNKSTYTAKPLETVLKSLVTNNLTSTATTGNGRARNGTSGGAVNGLTITVEADSARGSTIERNNHGAIVLKELQDCVEDAYLKGTGGDFDLIQTAPATFQFRYYPNQLGTDRSASVFFSVERANMANPVYIEDRTEEKTVAVVAGKGDKAAKAFVVRTGNGFAATNDIETWINGTNEDTTAALNSRGDQELRQLRADISFTYEVRQAKNARLDVDYSLGDRVKGEWITVSSIQKVNAVKTSKSQDAKETIAIELVDV